MTAHRIRAPAAVRALLPAKEWHRVESYVLDDAGFGTDVFGADPSAFGTGYAIGYWLHRVYFRVLSEGHGHIPRAGAGILAGNHSGVLPFDGLMIGTDVFRHTEPPRLVRYMVDFFAYRTPFLGRFLRQIGQVPGTRRNFDGLMEEGHLVGVFPEGAAALGKPRSQAYQLLPFSAGHVELAARHGVPIVPFGLVGAEEQQTMLGDLRPLARALRLPYFPLTTTFPLLGPLGLLPRPVRYFIRYGPPIQVDPDALRRVAVRERETSRVRDAVAELVRAGLRWRERVQREGTAALEPAPEARRGDPDEVGR
jgi:1-acyl-sn-glycerol-3-phosphate acyltransferase